jgi:hypothetical protein
VYKAGSTTRAVEPTRHVRSAAFDESGVVPPRLSRVLLAFAPPCPHLETASAATVDATPGDLLRANASHPVEPRSSRLSLPAQDLCNSKALRPIQEVLARMIGVRAPRSRSRCMRFSRRASPATARGYRRVLTSCNATL